MYLDLSLKIDRYKAFKQVCKKMMNLVNKKILDNWKKYWKF
jgi:hypothetical protein